MPYQHGFRNVVAVIGSALTEKHVHQIKRLTRRVTLALDPDAAGESATVRGIQVAQRAFDRVVVPVPRRALWARRPTARASRRGWCASRSRWTPRSPSRGCPRTKTPMSSCGATRKAGALAIEQAQPLIDFLIEAETAGLALDTPQGKAEARKRLLPVIAEARDRTLADEYVGRLAQKLRLDKIELRRDLALTRQRLDRETRAARQRQSEQEAPSSVANEMPDAPDEADGDSRI